jgi:hypothetical protein
MSFRISITRCSQCGQGGVARTPLWHLGPEHKRDDAKPVLPDRRMRIVAELELPHLIAAFTQRKHITAEGRGGSQRDEEETFRSSLRATPRPSAVNPLDELPEIRRKPDARDRGGNLSE